MKTNKFVKSFLALLLLFAIAASTFAIAPSASAHDPPWQVPTWAYITCRNDPIGVNQQQFFNFWLNVPPPTSEGTFGDRWTFTVEIAKPDGGKDTIGPITSDAVGSKYTLYNCTQLGKYSAIVKFAGKTLDGTPNGFAPTGAGAEYAGDIYQASTSDPITWTVQQQPIQDWQEPPLPTSAWRTPVNDMNRGWSSLVGNWLGGAAQIAGPTTNFAYGAGPESAHVLWTKPVWAGGIMDSRFGDAGYQGAHYDGLWFYPPIILNGKLYYNALASPREGWYCVDLYTGQTEYYHNTTGPVTGVHGAYYDFSGSIAGETLSFGQILNYNSPNQMGGFPYLWSTSGNEDNAWLLFDQVTGNYICRIINAPSWIGGYGSSAVNVYGKDGSILYYNIVGQENPTDPSAPPTGPFYLQCWNTTQAIWYKSTWTANEYWMWRTYLNYTFDGNNGYSLNVSIPEMPGSIRAVREGQYIIGGTSGKHNSTYSENGKLWALSLEPGKEGTLLWEVEFTPPETSVPDIVTSGGSMTGPIVDPEDSVILFNQPITRQWWAFDLKTGQPLWGPSAQESAWNYYGMFYNIYNGMLFSYGSGQTGSNLVAYDVRTGQVKWTYVPSNEGFESPFGAYPLYCCAIADGKLYMYTTTHHSQQPLFRGAYVRCIDASNGAELWKLPLWNGIGIESNNAYGAISNGYFIGLNLYDNQLYCIGKGPSGTTVQIEDDVINNGNTVLIKGTVTDQSPGQTCLGTPAKGTPAIADADQQEWMAYLYEQQARPADAKGVPVKLTATDPSGNTQDIGATESDADGNFALSWTPHGEGKYQITALFEGSKSYGDSRAATSIQVVGAATGSSSASTNTVPAEAFYVVSAVLAILVIAVLVVLIRKK